ncbi:MAG: DUF899 domain-containing protein [Halioglobus sp.]|nr:DUF899 domain-containing protein [Halioglobus sp.]
MAGHTVVSQQEWRSARLELLEREKAFTQERDALAQARRDLPWVRIDKDYRFESERGEIGLAELFGDCSQLIVYHFMFGQDWQEGCPSCSFWADNYAGTLPHLRARDINLVVASRAPLATLLGYRERMGWGFDWVSTGLGDFSIDFAVSFDALEPPPREPNYNFGTQVFTGEEAPGLSVFLRDGDAVYHTYSCYARGLEDLNGAYRHLDIAPRGRDESDLPWPMAWVRRRDSYEEGGN